MTEETLIKYLDFIKTECLRYSSDKVVDESELQLFKLEIDKFKSLFNQSELKPIIKQKVNTIDFDLSLPKYKGINLLAYIIGNQWSNSKQREEIMAKKLKTISEKIEHTIIDVKTLA